MDIEQLKEQLRNQEVGYENIFKYPTKIPPRQIDNILDELGCDHQIAEDGNGWELSYSVTFNFEGMKITAYGSGYSGSMVFEVEK